MKKNMNLSSKIKILIAIALITFVAVFASALLSNSKNLNESKLNNIEIEKLKSYSIDELTKYNGTDASKPIYIGLNGYLYDVTQGRKFYEKGGTYNYLAGKDSSKELNLIGGEIIKQKYPVIGILK